MMKKIYTLLITLAVVFASCSRDDSAELPDNGTANRLTFNLSGAGGSLVTRGVTVSGNGFEKHIFDISVYLFEYSEDGSGLLRMIADFDNPDASDEKNILTLDVDASFNGTYVAYFIANNADGVFLDLSNPYGDQQAVAVDVTTEDFFRNMPAKAFTDIPGDKFLITGNIDTPFPAYGTHEVTLRNRVARFDVVNRHPELTITKVILQDAADRSSVFGDATRDCHPQTVNPADIETFAFVNYEINGEIVGKISESAFFLHPTSIPTTTRIYVEGYDSDNQTFVYEVDCDPITILANYRYQLVVADQAPVTIEVAGTWDVDDNVTTANAMPLQLASTGTAVINYTTMAIDYAGSVSFRLVTSNPNGPDYEFIPLTGGDPAYFVEFDTDDFGIRKNETKQTISYASLYYTTHFDFKLNAAPPAGMGFVSILRFTDRDNGQTLDMLIYRSEGFSTDFYPGSLLTGVEVGGVTWAPVNAGALASDEAGFYTQWNRTAGFRGGVTTDVVTGPLPFKVFYNPANDYTPQLYQQPFIVNRTGDATGDWLSAGDPYTATRSGLWNLSNHNPCPTGWQIPTATQMQSLVDAYTAGEYTDNGTSVSFTGDDGVSVLTLPYRGYLDSTDGKLYKNGFTGHYWSISAEGEQSTALSIGDSGVSLDAYPRAMGFTLRCVKQ